MNTVAEVINEIKANGSESSKSVLMKHGAREPFYGTKIEHLKKIQKKIKNNQQLALELYDTGISDAMYLAALVADGSKMSREQLQDWVLKAYWYMLSEYAVAWVAAEHHDGWDIALVWIISEEERIAAAGWSTISNIISVRDDEDLDKEKILELLEMVGITIHNAPNRVRYVMNGFVIAVGGYVSDFYEAALDTAKMIGKVSVDMGGTACKVPDAASYIDKMVKKNGLGAKRKKLKC